MERTYTYRVALLAALIALVGAFTTIAVADQAEAVTFYNGSCAVSASNYHYAYYQATTSSSDTDCTRVGVAWHTGSFSYDGVHPFAVEKVSASEPSGSLSWHYLKNATTGTTKYISYSW